jgi:IS605 OrfB family transposase
MKDRATIKIKLEDNIIVRQTLSVYSEAVNYAINSCWKTYRSYLKLYYAIYNEMRIKFPQLQSQLIATAIKKAYECCRKARTKSVFNGGIRYNPPRSFSIKNNILSISTINGRVKIPIKIPTCFSRYTDWKITESELFMRGGKLFFHLGVAKEINANIGSVKDFVGIDLGINHIAVTSKRHFFKGIMSHIDKFRKLKARLQSRGTKSARRHLKRLSGRQKRFTRDMNHIISKSIISEAKVRTLFIMEDLTGIGKRNRGRIFNGKISNWSRLQLRKFIEYKALRAGHSFMTISPEYTSQTCSHCGELGIRNRGFFHCNNCGYSCNSDLNASNNFLRRAKPLAIAFGLNVNKPIVVDNDGNDFHSVNPPESMISPHHL